MEHVSVYDVRDAVSHLKAHKRDGCTGLESDHIINAGDGCLMHVQGCSGAGTRRNAAPANILEPERRSGKCC